MNAIQQFAEEHGIDDSESLEQAFKSAVQSVIGNKGKVIDAWNDGGSIGYCDWNCSVEGVDGMAPNTEFMLTLTTNEQNGRSWLTCQYDTDDCDVLGDAEGTVGEFDPFPLFNKCLESASESCKAESKKSEAKKHVCSMQKKKESLAKKNEDASMEQVCDAALKASNFEDGYWAWTRAEADKIADKVLEEHPELDYDAVWDYVRESIVGHIYDNCNPV